MVSSDVAALIERYRVAHEALHRLWTAAVGTPDYNKADFRTIDNELARVFRDAARALGYDGPLGSGSR